MAKQPKCSCDKTPMHIHPQVIVRSLTVTWLNNYVAQHNILVFKNACVSFFHENDITEWLSCEKLIIPGVSNQK